MQHLLCSLTHTLPSGDSKLCTLSFPSLFKCSHDVKKKKRTNLSKLAGITYQTGQIHMNI